MTTMTNLTDKQYKDRLSAVILLRQQGYYTQAREVAGHLLQLRPEESSIWHQLAQIATATGDAQRAVHGFGKALELLRAHGALETHAAQFQAASLGYGQSLMRLGRFAEAWPYFEAGRLHVSWSPWPTTEYWDGSNSSHPESLLVQSEGGYGDVFMFMRWIPLLKKQFGIGRVGLMIFKGMADFCDWQALGVDEVYRTDLDKIPFGKWKYSTSIMSLAACFGMESWDQIPDPYTTPEGAAAAVTLALGDLRPGLPAEPDMFRLGFCWRAEENSSPIKTKSLEIETAAEMVRLIRESFPVLPRSPDDARRQLWEVEIHSLSPEKKDLYNTEPFIQPPGLIYLPDQMETWRKTAAYLCSMDFVLTVDTAVSHLCGLLGVACLVLIPRGGCWRYGPEDNTMHPWYRKYCKLYRQPKVLEWDAADIARAVMEEIDRHFGEFASC